MTRTLPLLFLVAVGCESASTPFSDTFDADGIFLVSADLGDGTLSWQGASTSEIALQGESWGAAASTETAAEREALNHWEYGVDGEALWLASSTPSSRAGVNFDLIGPGLMDFDVDTEGDVELSDVEGAAVITADSIDVEDFVGDADLYAASGSLNAEIHPWEGGELRLETANGQLDVYLPWGLDYDLQVWGDPDHEMIVEDLGWYEAIGDVAYFAGYRGRADIVVNIYAHGGKVTVHETW